MTRNVAVVAYPIFDDVDRDWIESVRAVHDPQASMLAAHFTLVFPTVVPAEDVNAELTEAAARSGRFAVVLRSALAVRNPMGPGGHVFLVPIEGAREITELHDRLYRGAFRPSLRSDIPYVPHVTVAASPDWQRCVTIAADLNDSARIVRGRVEGLVLLEVGGGIAKPIGQFPLGRE